MNVYVATLNIYAAPSSDVLGVATTEEGAQQLTRNFFSRLLVEAEDDDYASSYEEFSDVMQDEYLCEIEETELFESKLVHTAEGGLELH